MGCLKSESLIGILEIQLNAEEQAVARSHGIVSIPNKELENFSAFDLYYITYTLGRKRRLALSIDLQCVVHTSERERRLLMLMQCELCILSVILNQGKYKCKHKVKMSISS
jgi:hypothetical protein